MDIFFFNECTAQGWHLVVSLYTSTKFLTILQCLDCDSSTVVQEVFEMFGLILQLWFKKLAIGPLPFKKKTFTDIVKAEKYIRSYINHLLISEPIF